MEKVTILHNQIDKAISIMREVAAWGRSRGFRIWPDAVPGEAVYLHKLCVCREFAHRGMTKMVLEAIREECQERGIRYIRLDTGLDEKAVRKIYLHAGFKIVDIIDYANGRSLALYKLEV